MKKIVSLLSVLLVLVLVFLCGCSSGGYVKEPGEETQTAEPQAALPGPTGETSAPEGDAQEPSAAPVTDSPEVSAAPVPDVSAEPGGPGGESDPVSSPPSEEAGGEPSPEPSEALSATPSPEPSAEPSNDPSDLDTEETARPSHDPVYVPSDAEDYISHALETMTVEEKVGQMFLVQYPGYGAAELAAEYHLGGYLFFDSFFEYSYPSEVADSIREMQAACAIPMFMAVDEEGGSVCRVSYYPQFRDTKFRSPRSVLADGGLEYARSDCAEKSQLLLSLGLNMNLGPVCDVTSDEDAFMFWRSPGSDAGIVCSYVSAVVSEMNRQGIGCALKHFPGYGNNLDTHTQIVFDYRDYSEFEQTDFLPFSAGIDAGAGCIMVSHSIVQCMDPDRPASLSKSVHDILRNELGFSGVLVTDDISMSAVTDYTSGTEAAVMAVEAGNDLLCCSDFYSQIPAVVSAVEDGRISLDRIDRSVERLLRLKLSLGIIPL